MLEFLQCPGTVMSCPLGAETDQFTITMSE